MILVVFDCFLVCNDVPFSSLDLVSHCFLLVVNGSQEPSLARFIATGFSCFLGLFFQCTVLVNVCGFLVCFCF